nr:DUF1173 family protein [Rhizobium grahamii]
MAADRECYERLLVERLARLRTKSVTGLRFDLARDQPFANATLPEMKPQRVALYIVQAVGRRGIRSVASGYGDRPIRPVGMDLASCRWRDAAAAAAKPGMNAVGETQHHHRSKRVSPQRL